MAHGNAVTRFMYKHNPRFLKTLMANCYGISDSFKKYGKYYHAYYDFLKRSQWFSSDELEQYQLSELKKMITHAVQNVSYYSDLFKKLSLSPDDINSIEDLKKLPVLTKEDLRFNFKRLKSTKHASRDIFLGHTSGSTGKALNLFISKKAYQREQACIWLHRSWGGLKYRDKTATFAGHLVVDVNHKKPPFWIDHFFENQVIFSSYHMNRENLKYYAEKLVQFQPKLVWGYPSSIYVMASYLNENSITEVRPEAVYTSSETLFDYQRKAMEEAFQAKIFDYYANSEMASKILECEKGGLHIQHQWGIVEFLDNHDEPVKIGQEGRMICTGFVNDAMPLIRYDIGDIAVPTSRMCTCGRQSTLVDRVLGRFDDFIVTSDGRKVGVLAHVFYETPKVREVQIIQETKNTLILKVVRRSGYSDKDTKNIASLMRNRVGNNMKIKFEFIEHIPRLPNGKFKFVISKVPVDS